MNDINLFQYIKCLYGYINNYLKLPVYFGRSTHNVPEQSIIIFPYLTNRISCGLSGIIYTTNKKLKSKSIDTDSLFNMAIKLEDNDFSNFMNNHLNLESGYLGGDHHINTLFKAVCSIKNNGIFYTLYRRGHYFLLNRLP